MDGHDYEEGVRRFVAAVGEGASVDDALAGSARSVRHDRVIAAAREMLAADGTIDMKQLAAQASMSRASLYRYYPDRLSVAGAVAAAGLDRMLAAARPHRGAGPRLGVALRWLVDHPAEAAAVTLVAGAVGVEALSSLVILLSGDAEGEVATPTVLGFAMLAASAHRTGDADRVVGLLDRYVARVDGPAD